MKAYVVKYIESYGIMEVEAKKTLDPKVIISTTVKGKFHESYYEGEWTFDQNKAYEMALVEIDNCRKMLVKRLDAIDKLEIEILTKKGDYRINGDGNCCS